jgi:hypothetical protein
VPRCGDLSLLQRALNYRMSPFSLAFVTSDTAKSLRYSPFALWLLAVRSLGSLWKFLLARHARWEWPWRTNIKAARPEPQRHRMNHNSGLLAL